MTRSMVGRSAPRAPSRVIINSVLLLSLILVTSTPATTRADDRSTNIPLESPVYSVLENLSARGVLPTYLAGTRPITVGEARRLLAEARAVMPVKSPDDPSLASMVGRLAGLLGKMPGALSGDQLNPVINSIYLRTSRLEGEALPYPGTSAEQHPLVFNSEGLEPGEGWSVMAGANVETTLRKASISLSPLVATNTGNADIIHSGYIKTGFGGFDLELGKQSLWWGQGRHGSLYLTSNASPLPMLRAQNPHPATLPWLLKYMGPVHADLFISRLEEDRAVPEPYLSGMRLDFKPLHNLEAGLTMMMMYGGRGRPGVDIKDYFDILLGENEGGVQDRSNKIAGFDLRVTFPRFQLYLEYGGEDEAGYWPSKNAAVVGFYFPAIAWDLALRLEYADLAPTAEIAAAWYRHSVYTDGYTYDDRILGHHVGGDGRDLFVEIMSGGQARGQWRMALDLEQRGVELQPVAERHSQVSMGLKRSFYPGGLELKMDFTLAVGRVDNANYIAGNNFTNTAVHFQITGRI